MPATIIRGWAPETAERDQRRVGIRTAPDWETCVEWVLSTISDPYKVPEEYRSALRALEPGMSFEYSSPALRGVHVVRRTR